jgi:hypothetical protein
MEYFRHELAEWLENLTGAKRMQAELAFSTWNPFNAESARRLLSVQSLPQQIVRYLCIHFGRRAGAELEEMA